MTVNLPSDIPKFEGNPRENPSMHITIYHLWCSSNSLVDDSVKLHLCQCTLDGDTTKWYIEFDTRSYSDVSSLAQTFLTQFQFPTQFDIDLDLLSNFKKYDAILISDHIHVWNRRKQLVGTKLFDEILCKWFILYLQPQIAKDVSMFHIVTKEECILVVKQLDLIC